MRSQRKIKKANDLKKIVNLDFDKIKPKWSVAQPKQTTKKEFSTIQSIQVINPQTSRPLKKSMVAG